MTMGAPAVCVRHTKTPITVTVPDEQKTFSTHMCNLNIPLHPSHMTQAHIVPRLGLSLLIPIKKVCDGRYKIIYDEQKVRV